MISSQPRGLRGELKLVDAVVVPELEDNMGISLVFF